MSLFEKHLAFNTMKNRLLCMLKVIKKFSLKNFFNRLSVRDSIHFKVRLKNYHSSWSGHKQQQNLRSNLFSRISWARSFKCTFLRTKKNKLNINFNPETSHKVCFPVMKKLFSKNYASSLKVQWKTRHL